MRTTDAERIRPNVSYLLSAATGEVERLRLQATVWEPDAEAMLDRIGVGRGWSCIDIGCGAVGILGPLSRRVGPEGHVVGLDINPEQLAAATRFVREQHLINTELLERDAYDTGLARASFDFVHVRFLFAPAGRDMALLSEMLRLVRPGGILAIQEPDTVAWACCPPHPAWTRLTNVVRAVFTCGGGDLDAGRRTYAMLRSSGLLAVQLRAAVLALSDDHPYSRLPILLASSLRERILECGLIEAAELDQVIDACEAISSDHDRYITSFIVTQAWGRMPTSSYVTLA